MGFLKRVAFWKDRHGHEASQRNNLPQPRTDQGTSHQSGLCQSKAQQSGVRQPFLRQSVVHKGGVRLSDTRHPLDRQTDAQNVSVRQKYIQNLGDPQGGDQHDVSRQRVDRVRIQPQSVVHSIGSRQSIVNQSTVQSVPPRPQGGQYEYTLLRPGHIRLFEVSDISRSQQGRSKANIKVKIRHVALDEVENRFTALSYYWGDPSAAKVSVLVQNQTEDSSPRLLSITESLESLLRRLPLMRAPLPTACEGETVCSLIWADGICINQSGTEGPFLQERNDQVQLMGKIYRAAKNVCFDLGLLDRYASLAIPFINEISDGVARARIDGVRRPLREYEYSKYGLPPATDRKWTAWVKFLARSWFRRMWVLQEYTLARAGIMICGTIQIEWTWLPKLMGIMFDGGLHPGLRSLGLGFSEGELDASKKSILAILAMGVWREWIGKGQLPRLFSALTTSMTFEMTDTRDRIYALLGICSGLRDGDIATRIDYGESDSAVFQRFAQWMILNDPMAIRIFCYCGEGEQKEIPTWCPSWTDNNWNGGAPFGMHDQESGYNAGGATPSAISFTPDNNGLIVQGFLVDVIRHTGPEYCSPNTQANLFDWERSAKLFAIRTILGDSSLSQKYRRTAAAPEYRTVEESLMQAYTRTISGNFIKHAGSTIPDETFSSSYERFELEREGLGAQYRTDLNDVDLVEYSKRITVVSLGRRLCITESGRLAICPSRTTAGDTVCIVPGSSMPLILTTRPVPEFEAEYQLRGAAYVHGLTCGEVGVLRGKSPFPITIV